MHFCYRILLCIIYLGLLIQCRGYAGSSAGDNHYGGTVISCSSNNCRRYTAIIAGSIVGGGTGIALLLISLLACYCRCRNRPSQTNMTFVNAINTKITKGNSSGINLFKSGIWSSRYLQFGIWHGPTSLSLSFDSQLFQVIGSGSDDIGTFTINGIYSNKTSRIGLTQMYGLAAIRHNENLAHPIIIQLIWNDKTRQFEGKRYMRTKRYREGNRFELKLSKQQQQISPVERV